MPAAYIPRVPLLPPAPVTASRTACGRTRAHYIRSRLLWDIVSRPFTNTLATPRACPTHLPPFTVVPPPFATTDLPARCFPHHHLLCRPQRHAYFLHRSATLPAPGLRSTTAHRAFAMPVDVHTVRMGCRTPTLPFHWFRAYGLRALPRLKPRSYTTAATAYLPTHGLPFATTKHMTPRQFPTPARTARRYVLDGHLLLHYRLTRAWRSMPAHCSATACYLVGTNYGV